MVLAALYAGDHDLSIGGVVASAALGAIVGDNVGYWVGREFGYRFLLRFGGYVGLSESKIKLGQYLFLRHGGKVVFFGRFVAILRILAAFLAGVNRMDWACAFGRAVLGVTGPLGIALACVGLVIIVGTVAFVRSHEAELEAQAERALPGPLQPVHRTGAHADDGA